MSGSVTRELESISDFLLKTSKNIKSLSETGIDERAKAVMAVNMLTGIFGKLQIEELVSCACSEELKRVASKPDYVVCEPGAVCR